MFTTVEIFFKPASSGGGTFKEYLDALSKVKFEEGAGASQAINRELGDQTSIAYLIEDYAGLAAAESRPEKALRLAGFADALRESIGAPLPPSEQARVDRMIAPARAALPESTVAAEWEAGQSLALEQAIELALSVT